MTFNLPESIDLVYEKNNTPIKMRIDVTTFNDEQLLKLVTIGLRVTTYPKALKFAGKIVNSQAVFPSELQLQSL